MPVANAGSADICELVRDKVSKVLEWCWSGVLKY